MLSVVQFTVNFPHISGDIGMSLGKMGKFVTLASVSAQAENYGLIKNDRIININGSDCVGKETGFVVDLIKKYRTKNQLYIHFERSFPVEDTAKIDKEIKAPLDNDAVFQEGLTKLQYNSKKLGDVYIRILRMKGKLLLTAKQFNLVPYSISLLYFKDSAATDPISGFNLLPCTVYINKPDIQNNQYSFTLSSLMDNYIFTLSTKIEFNQWLLVICDIIKQDIQPLLADFNKYFHKENEADSVQLQKKEEEELFRQMKNCLNIPVYTDIACIYKELLDIIVNNIPAPALQDRIKLLVSYKAKFLDNGYAPSHIYHSLMAYLLTIYNKLPNKEEWNSEVQANIKELATFFHQQQETYIRNNLVRQGGFLVFGCLDPAILGIYLPVLRSNYNGDIYENESNTRLYMDMSTGNKIRWILIKHNETTPSFYCYDIQSFPSRFQWISDQPTEYTPIVQAILQ